MREIKFRCWDNIKKVMKSGDEFWFIQNTKNECDKWRQVSRVTGMAICETDFCNGEIMQAIGAKDKNDKEAYEGDIVKVKGTKRVGEYVTEIIWDVFGFKLKENKTYVNDHYFTKNMFEIIGNIYENPELLNP